MDNNIKIVNPNPQSRANLISKLLFTWLIKLCKQSNRENLKIKDLYENANSDKSEKLCNDLEKHWNSEIEMAKLNNSTPSLLRAIRKTFFLYYMFCGFLLFIQYTLIRPLQPIMLSIFIGLFTPNPLIESSKSDLGEMCLFGGIIILITFVLLFFNHHTSLMLGRVGMRIRIACCSLVYRKLLRLSQESLGQSGAGQLVNLLSNDVSRFDLVTQLLHFFWIMPIQVALVTYLIWRQVQLAAFIGVGFLLVLTIPVHLCVGKLSSIFRLKTATRTDTRVRKMAEIVAGIQVIKMYAWEIPFAKVVNVVRKREIQILTWASYVRGVILSSAVFIERTILYITIIAYVLLGNTITAEIAFSLAQFVNMLQLSTAIFFPQAVSVGAETLVSIKRLENFLMLEEKATAKIDQDDSKAIAFKNVRASWVPQVYVLKDLSVSIKAGSLCAVVGPVGSGKSSLLQLLLGELTCNSGTVAVGGQISYSSQEAWLFASTVRKNILFGQAYDRRLYNEVVKVGALERDFELFAEGDQTMVGDRGVSLSGGQKARINLARAVYRSADIYLLDDPLSAVDTHVGKHLFNECIVNYLKDKTRILVTHQLQFLKKADHIVVINEGKVEAQGTFQELSKLNFQFTKMLVASDESGDSKDLEPRPALQVVEEKRKVSLIRTLSVRSAVSIVASESPEVIIADEEEAASKYGSKAYSEYAKAGGNFCVLTLLAILLIGGQLTTNLTDLWLKYWTEQEALRSSDQECATSLLTSKRELFNNTEKSIVKRSLSDPNLLLKNIERICEVISENLAIYIYTGLIVISIVVLTVRSLTFYKVAMKASQNLHNKMFSSLLQAPMRFFDTNPSGRILNRFSRDMGMIDELLPRMMLEALQIFLVMTGILVMVFIQNVYMIAIVAVLAVMFYKMRGWYMTVARDVKHLEGTSKSPVFSHLNASFNGIVTIRSSKREQILMKEFDLHQDVHTSAWYIFLVTVSAFGLWLDFLSFIFLTCTIASFIIINQLGVVSGSAVGLALSQSLILTGMVQYGMRQAAEVVSQMTCVERVLDYTVLEKEETEEDKNRLPPDDWPRKGKVEFSQVYLYYSETEPPVLKDLTFTINAGEKIGIVGRTGAGKSSLISALFRLTPYDGKILIDQLDTKAISLNHLRKKISIIPQEPVLFSATLRYNLDPFQEFSDQELWTALEEVELKDAASLEFLVQEGGSNFSVGQRQLICLARAILRNNNILVLDEATANVDPQTDELIQKTIRTKFKGCTVLTIAHRLHTIMDGDKVIVMDAGRLVEYDHPHQLLQNPNGYLSKMVEQTGESMSNHLHSVARGTFNTKDNLEDDSS